MAINLDKTIIEEVVASDRPNFKRLVKYLHTCDQCGKERGYFIKSFDRVTKCGGLCRSCAALRLGPKGEITKKRISNTRKKKFTTGELVPSFLGCYHSLEVKEKLKQIAGTRVPVAGWNHSEESKRKISCSHREILLEEFDDFVTTESDKQRVLFKSQGWHWKCFELANYKCDCCQQNRDNEITLHAHHLDGWNWAYERRFELTNLVSLCEKCHSAFHLEFGKGNNTSVQYGEFKLKWQKK